MDIGVFLKRLLSIAVVTVFLTSCESIPKKERAEIPDLSTPEHEAKPKSEEVERLMLYGQGYYDIGDYGSALHAYNRALTLDADHMEAKRGKIMSERAMEMANQGSFLDYQRY